MGEIPEADSRIGGYQELGIRGLGGGSRDTDIQLGSRNKFKRPRPQHRDCRWQQCAAYLKNPRVDVQCSHHENCNRLR